MIEYETDRMIMKNEECELVNRQLKFPERKFIEDITKLKPVKEAFIFYDKQRPEKQICNIGIKSTRRPMEISYGTEEEYRNQKYMQEALKAFVNWIFSKTDIEEIHALICNNCQSQHILEKSGFKESGYYEDNPEQIWFTIKKCNENN